MRNSIGTFFIIAFFTFCTSFQNIGDGFEKYDYFDYFELTGKNDGCTSKGNVYIKKNNDTLNVIQHGLDYNNGINEVFIKRENIWESNRSYKFVRKGNQRIDTNKFYHTYKLVKKDSLLIFSLKKSDSFFVDKIEVRTKSKNEIYWFNEVDWGIFINGSKFHQKELQEKSTYYSVLHKYEKECKFYLEGETYIREKVRKYSEEVEKGQYFNDNDYGASIRIIETSDDILHLHETLRSFCKFY